ncbi:hypothetical protein FQN54_008319 [Arachnomyces sp. PD_36]|nr:hypothetical protein FQN54_008319 [Arachnomyces sp. PD_36]
MRVSDPIKEDHRELESYYHQIIKATDNDTKTRYQNQFTWELARHSIAEELLIYPIMEKKVEGGKEKADRDREEHRKIKELLKQFQNLDASEGLFLTTIEGLMRDLRQHTKEEEEDDLPALERVLSVEESDELSKSFERTKMLTPTRSHPSAPDKPPFETVVGLMAAPIDHVADLFRKFPKE